LDRDFGGDGKVTTPVGSGSGNDFAYAVATDSEGRIVVGGSASNPSTSYDFAVVRYEIRGNPGAQYQGEIRGHNTSNGKIGRLETGT
jgi:hypothetical protein